MREYCRGFKGDTRSLDYSSFHGYNQKLGCRISGLGKSGRFPGLGL